MLITKDQQSNLKLYSRNVNNYVLPATKCNFQAVETDRQTDTIRLKWGFVGNKNNNYGEKLHRVPKTHNIIKQRKRSKIKM